MICRSCLNEISDDSKFCFCCGTPVKKPSTFKGALAAIGKAVCYFLYFFAVQIIVLFIYALAVGVKIGISLAMSGGIPDPEAIAELLMKEVYSSINEAMIISALVTLFGLFIVFLIRKRKFHREIRLMPTSPVSLLYAVILGAAMQIVTSVTLAFLEPFLSESLFEALDDNYSSIYQGSPLAMFINIAIITPIIEETIFRGLIFNRMRSAMPKALAVILSSLIFGIAHGNVIGFFYASILGALLALVFDKYDSVIPGILLHAEFNATSLFLSQILPDNELLIMASYFVSIALIIGIMYLILKKKPLIVYENDELDTPEHNEISGNNNNDNIERHSYETL